METINTLIIIGNGYDLAYSLPTRYEDFINSELFQQNVENNNLFEFIMQEYEKKNWCDLEMMLLRYERELAREYNYSDDPFDEAWVLSDDKRLFDEEVGTFEEEVFLLKDLLLQYLTGLNQNFVFNGKKKSKILIGTSTSNSLENLKPIFPFGELQKCWREESSSGTNIISFNYTEPIGLSSLFGDDSIRHIHGRLTDGQIVLGVDDSQYVTPECNFLKKIAQGGTEMNDLDDMLNVDRFIIWGCSMGGTDRWFFEKIFKGKTHKVFEIYAHNQKAIAQIKGNLANICGDQRDFEMNNLVKTFVFNSTTESTILEQRHIMFNSELDYLSKHNSPKKM